MANLIDLRDLLLRHIWPMDVIDFFPTLRCACQTFKELLPFKHGMCQWIVLCRKLTFARVPVVPDLAFVTQVAEWIHDINNCMNMDVRDGSLLFLALNVQSVFWTSLTFQGHNYAWMVRKEAAMFFSRFGIFSRHRRSAPEIG